MISPFFALPSYFYLYLQQTYLKMLGFLYPYVLVFLIGLLLLSLSFMIAQWQSQVLYNISVAVPVHMIVQW